MDPVDVGLGQTLKDAVVHAVDDQDLILRDDKDPVVEGHVLILRDAKDQVDDGHALILSNATNLKGIKRKKAESWSLSTSTKESCYQKISKV